MKTDRIQYLLENYLSQNCSLDEKKELNSLINSLKDEDLKNEFRTLWMDYYSSTTLPEEDSQDILTSILTDKKTIKLTQRRKTARSVSLRIISVAASLLIFVSVGIYLRKENTSQVSGSFIAKAVLVSPDQATSYIRHLTLPDGTSVVLKSGSTIHYPEKFTGKKREVILKGEAYFDVKHMNSKPFIIHTGNVKTTVLGTAFDIKAWPGQENVIVSVKRGKVRVENDKKVLAVLTVNQEIKYNTTRNDAVKSILPSDKVVAKWAREDMVFDHVTLSEITQTLSKRYEKDIEIENKELADMVMVSSFKGTESLNDILEVLCGVYPNTVFSIKEKIVIISSK